MKTYHNAGTMTASVAADAPKGWTLCGRWADHRVKLEQNEKTKLFRVTYDLQVNDDLTYEQACDYLVVALLVWLDDDDDVDNTLGD